MNKKILIAAYNYPPNKGIGSRRWAKLSKALAQRGWEVYVIKATSLEGETSKQLMPDIEHSNIKVFEHPRKYPRTFSSPRWIRSIHYRINSAFLRFRYKGTIRDRTIAWERSFCKLAKNLIDQYNIKYIAGTGAPFNLLYYLALIKAQNPNLILLVDFRDPWLNAINYGMPNLSGARKQEEQRKHDFVLEKADLITAPNSYMLEELQKLTLKPFLPEKFIALNHFFDEEQYGKLFFRKGKHNSQTINIVYGGALIENLSGTLQNFSSWLNQLKFEKPDIYKKVKISIYTDTAQYNSLLKKNDSAFNVSPTIGNKFFPVLQDADFAVIFTAEHNKNYLTTKFAEYLYFKKRILVFGAKGYVTEFIESNRLGKYIQTYQDLLQELTSIHSFPEDFDCSTFSLESIASKLEEMLLEVK